ncbi:Uncharacterised protein [Legionella busanensis]|uniref:Uncharacterized protein n=1 Tax=Legionella busanensis TaxID=190655 RepID=A0A378JFF4_9GAMM|nr:hypothetical protein [Legionella busanensis]STX49996.1 Uncharacterised protein [Legionella busanensis]
MISKEKRRGDDPEKIHSLQLKEKKLLQLMKPERFAEIHHTIREHIKWVDVIKLTRYASVKQESEEEFEKGLLRANKSQSLPRTNHPQRFFSSTDGNLTERERKVIERNMQKIKLLREMASSTPESDVPTRVKIESWKKIEAEIEKLESKNETILSKAGMSSKSPAIGVIENQIHYLKEGIRGVSLEGKSKVSLEKVSKHLEVVKEQIETLRVEIDKYREDANTSRQISQPI